MFSNFGAMGLGRATGIIVGQNLGANKLDRARKAIGCGLLYVSVMKLILGVIIFMFPAAIITIFSTDGNVVELAVLWLRIQVIGTIFMGMGMVFQQAFNTAGDTLAPMVVTLFAMWIVELPVAWVLMNQFGMGPIGIAYARILSMLIRVLVYFPYFYWGRWSKLKPLGSE